MSIGTYLTSKGITREMLLDLPVIADTFQFQIDKYYTNVDGTLIAKAAAPAVLRQKTPVYLLGNYDRNGAYRIAQKVRPPFAGCLYLGTFIYGFSLTPPFLNMSGFNDIKSRLNLGDLIVVYTDSIDAPTTFLWIVQSNVFAAVGSFVQNTDSTLKDGKLNKLKVGSSIYQCSTVDQYAEGWHFTRTTNAGDYKDDSAEIAIYKSPNFKLSDFVEVKIPFLISQFIGINFYMLDACDRINIDLKLLK